MILFLLNSKTNDLNFLLQTEDVVQEEEIFVRLQKTIQQVSYGPPMVETLKKCLQVNPLNRISVEELDKSEVFNIS